MAESAYDRIRREQREAEAASVIPSESEAKFLGESLTPVAEKVRAEVADGLRKVLGEPLPGEIEGMAPHRRFYVEADSPAEGARARVFVTLTGIGPEFENRDAVRYKINAEIQCRRMVGAAFGPMQRIFIRKDMYGPGRPGIDNMDVQSAVVNELIRQNPVEPKS